MQTAKKQGVSFEVLKPQKSSTLCRPTRISKQYLKSSVWMVQLTIGLVLEEYPFHLVSTKFYIYHGLVHALDARRVDGKNASRT